MHINNSLIIQYLPVAKAVAARYAQRNPHIERDDFFSAAYAGICEAARRFDPSKKFSFAPYARKWCEWSCAAVLRDPLYDLHRLSYDEFDRGADGENSTTKMVVECSEPHVDPPSDLGSLAALIERAQIPHGVQIATLLMAGASEAEVAETLHLTEQALLPLLDRLRTALASVAGTTAPRILTFLNTRDYARKTKTPLKSIYKHLTQGRIDAKKREGSWLIPTSTPLICSTPQGPMVPSFALGKLLGLRRERAAREVIERALKKSRNPAPHKLRRKIDTGGRHAQEYLVAPQFALQLIRRSRTERARQLQAHLTLIRNLAPQEQIIHLARQVTEVA